MEDQQEAPEVTEVSTTSNIDQLAKVYVKIREKKREAEQQIKEYEEKLAILQAEMLEFCKEQGVTSIRTDHGTVSRRTTKNYSTHDWESFINFMKEHDAFSLIQQRIHTSNMTQFLEENPEVYPPGLQADVKYSIVITKR